MAPAEQDLVPGRDAMGRLLMHLHLLGGTATRAELTELLGCSRSVMGYLLGELTDRGVTAVDRAARGAATPEGGRPSHRVSVADTAPTVVAVRLDVDTVTVATVGLGGRVLGRTEQPLRDPRELPAELDRICALIAEQADGDERLLGIGMAVPSPIRRSDGYAFAALHLHWPGTPLRDLMRQRLADNHGLAVPLHLGNDANLAALAEHRHGAGRGARQLLYLTTAQMGLGGALVSNGKVFDGAHGYAIEPGHITVDPVGEPCACGSTGCLEVEADHRGLVRAAGRGQTPLSHTAAAAGEILGSAESGDPAALRAVRHVSALLGSGLASLTNLTDPDLILLAGSLADYHRLAPEPLIDQLTSRSFLTHDHTVPVAAGTLPDAALIGAADFAIQPLLDDPRGVLDRISKP